MKLTGLHIYGYGKFLDFQMENISSIHIFYGENEAGKSTIMSFIHSILFGFPSRQQSASRYEPKTNSAYGGSLTIETKDFGEVVIERVRGKSVGDVSVLLANGTVGGDELLAEILEGMDKTLFQSIFSFDLQGLQEVQRLKGDEISRYLIAAGTMGTDQLFQAEQQLQKELDHLFKPNGRKPILNEQLKELYEHEQALNLAKQKNAQYEALSLEKVKLTQEIIEVEDQLARNRGEHQGCEELLLKWPLLLERKSIKQWLQKFPPLEFPADGLIRYEKYADRLLTVTSRIKSIYDKTQETHGLLEEHSPLEFDMIAAENVIAEWPQYKQTEKEITEIGIEISGLELRRDEIIQDLHLPLEKIADVKTIDLGIDTKGRIRETLQQFMRLDSQIIELKSQAQLVYDEQVQIEKKCQEIEDQLLSEQDFKQLQKQQEDWRSSEQLSSEKTILEGDLKLSLDRKINEERREKVERKRSYTINGLLIVLCLSMLGWSMISEQWMLASFALIVIAYSAANIWRASRISEQAETVLEIERLGKRLDAVTTALSKSEVNGSDSFQQYEAQCLLREEWQKWYLLLEQKQLQMNQVKDQITKVKTLMDTKQTELETIKIQLGLRASFSNVRIEDAYDLLVELSQLLKMIERLKSQCRQRQQTVEQWLLNLHEITAAAKLEWTEVEKVVFHLQDLLKKELEKKVIYKELFVKLSELAEEAQQLENENLVLTSALSQLEKAANTDNEEDFRNKAKDYEEYSKLTERLSLLESQLEPKLINNAQVFASEEKIKEQLKKLKSTIEKLLLELSQMRDRLAALKHELKILEDGGTYTEKLHTFHQLKSIFNEEAREWAKLAIAKKLLQQTMSTYKKDRLPKVIIKAEEFMAFLTNGEYSHIYFQTDGRLFIERNDKILFDPIELSQGTKEQLYTALRFALVHVLEEDYSFPIIIDDGFVNFDRKRTAKVLQLITQMGKTSQILLFTCHKRMLEQFQAEEITYLSDRIRLSVE